MTLSPKTTQKICTQRAERRQPKRLKNWCSSSKQVCAAETLPFQVGLVFLTAAPWAELRPRRGWDPALQPDPTAKGKHLCRPVRFGAVCLEGGQKSPGEALCHWHSFLLMLKAGTVQSTHHLFACCPGRAWLNHMQQSKS